jgi:geranylgeranyl pyrophosphate synthase
MAASSQDIYAQVDPVTDSGKNLGDYMREGKATLPLIVDMKRGNPSQFELLKRDNDI